MTPMVASFRLVMIIHHQIGVKHHSNHILLTKIFMNNSALTVVHKDLAVQFIIREILMGTDGKVEIHTMNELEEIKAAITEETIGKIAMTTER